MDQTKQPWATWFQENSDKLVLLFMWLVMLIYIPVIWKMTNDKDSVHWGREAAGAIGGCLFGMVTGSRLAKQSQTGGIQVNTTSTEEKGK